MNIPKPIPRQKMPREAKKVFSGVIFDVYQWKQKLFDGTEATFENLKRRFSVNILGTTKKGEVILIKESQPAMASYWGVPAGMANKVGDDPLKVAKREFLEETGYQSDDWGFWFIHQPTAKIHWFIYIFIARDCIKVSEQRLDGGEDTQVRLVSFDDFLKILLRDDFRDYELKFKLLEAMIDSKKMVKLKKLFFKN